jgi:hypothetical protein
VYELGVISIDPASSAKSRHTDGGGGDTTPVGDVGGSNVTCWGENGVMEGLASFWGKGRTEGTDMSSMVEMGMAVLDDAVVMVWDGSARLQKLGRRLGGL